jgi:preprotein translocase subunit YajC
VGAEAIMNSGAVGASLLFFLQASPTGGIMAFLPLIIIMVIFYVLLILPAQRRQKKTQSMLAALKTGDKVVTNGGLYGTIVGMEGEAVQLRIGSGSEQLKVKVARSAVAGVESDGKEG